MERSRRKEIKRHLSEDEIDELLREAEDDHRLRRLGFLKNLYRGDSIPEAAERIGRSPSTGDHWTAVEVSGGSSSHQRGIQCGVQSKLPRNVSSKARVVVREATSKASDSAREPSCEYTRKRAHQLGIDLVFISSGSPHLNPIEKVWDYLKWTISPITVEYESEFKEFVQGTFDQITRRVRFEKKWCQKFLDFQKLS